MLDDNATLPPKPNSPHLSKRNANRIVGIGASEGSDRRATAPRLEPKGRATGLDGLGEMSRLRDGGRRSMDSRTAQVDRYERYVKRAREVLDKLDRSTLVHLVRASEESSEIDGYPAGSGNDGGRSGMRTILVENEDGEAEAIEVTATEAAMFKRLDGTHSDPLLMALENIFASLVEMVGHAEIIAKRVPVVVFANSRMIGRVSELRQCRGCHREVACTIKDPMRGGYCSACSTRWYEWKASFAGDDVATARRFFEAQRPRFDGHHEPSCEMCAYLVELAKPAIAS